MDHNDEDVIFESMQKEARRGGRRGVRWGVRTGNTLRLDPWEERRVTKRTHTSFVVIDRKEEMAANGSRESGSEPYRYAHANLSSERASERARKGRLAENSPNVNHSLPGAAVHYSLDKHKNWEMLDEYAKQQQRRSLAMSYSDTDDISDHDEDSDDTVPRVAVIQDIERNNESPTQQMLKKQNIAGQFVERTIKNAPLNEETGSDDESAAATTKFVVSKGRKGFTVRERRPRGKKGVKAPTHHNRHASEIYDLAQADTLIIANSSPSQRDIVASHIDRSGCGCSLCFPPKPNMHIRKKANFQKLLQQL